jgi:hypothetical protein
VNLPRPAGLISYGGVLMRFLFNIGVGRSCPSQVPKKGDHPHRDYSNVIYMNGGEHLHSILIHIRQHSIARNSAFVEEMP